MLPPICTVSSPMAGGCPTYFSGQNHFQSLLVKHPAGAPKNVASHSHYSDPIPADGEIHGASRRAGDINRCAQLQVIGSMLQQARASYLSNEDTALLLAVAKLESGFNPDAAAGSTSASGLGQFINATGKAYGITPSTRFDIGANIRAMIRYLSDCSKAAFKAFGTSGDELAMQTYAEYHDGPSLQYGGLGIANSMLKPSYLAFKDAVNAYSTDPQVPSEETVEAAPACSEPATGAEALASPAADSGSSWFSGAVSYLFDSF